MNVSKSPKGHAVTEETTEALLNASKVLGEPVRIRILCLIAGARDGICIADMVPTIRLTQPTVSHHVAMLVEANLVTVTQVGIRKYLRINKGEFERVIELLKELLPAAPVAE